MIISTLGIIDSLSEFLKRRISTKIVGRSIQLKTNSKIKECILTLPNEFNVSGSVVGLLKGEMLFSKKCLSIFVFANSNPIAINLVLELLKSLGVKIENLSICLEISCKDVTNVNKLIENAIEFWSKNTNIFSHRLKDKIKLRYKFKPNAICGTLHLRINNKILRGILQITTNLGIQVAKTNKIFAIDFIRGIIAAEGNININSKTKCLRMVRISAKLKKDREEFKKILRCIGIKIYSKDMRTIGKKEARELNWKSSGRGGAILINRFSNFIVLLEVDAFAIYPEKRNNFLSGFIEMKSTKNLLRFKKLPETFTLEIMKKTFKLSRKPIDTKNNFLKLNFIRQISGTGRSNNPLIFKLTGRAEKVLGHINNYFGLI